MQSGRRREDFEQEDTEGLRTVPRRLLPVAGASKRGFQSLHLAISVSSCSKTSFKLVGKISLR